MHKDEIHKQVRILAVFLSTRGFGYAVLESGRGLVDFGKMRFTERKNAGSLAGIEKVMVRNQPDVLVLQAVNSKGRERCARIRKLHESVLVLARQHRTRVVTVSWEKLGTELLGNPKGTKYGMAQMMAKKFPDELASRLPPKSRAGNNQDQRMDIFGAVALAITLNHLVR